MDPKVALLILDGFGIGKQDHTNAIHLAKMPFYKELLRRYPSSKLKTQGRDVGLPEGQMGNSEVGHINIGAGRIVYQSLTKINLAIADGSFHNHPVLESTFMEAKNRQKNVHLIGLLSEGGVHSHMHHVYALLYKAKGVGLSNIFIHGFLDGRDTDIFAGFLSSQRMHMACEAIGIGKIATLCGRFYGMDRDKRWDRTQVAYRALVHREGQKTHNIYKSILEHYKRNETDEFIHPIIACDADSQPVGQIEPGDTLVFFNFRPDRMRQIVSCFYDAENFTHFPVRKDLNCSLLSFTEYSSEYQFPILFPKEEIQHPLGEVLSKENIAQFRAAETEKYPHITFFFNAMIEKPYPQEHRLLVDSPKVSTYDLKPEMSAIPLTKQTIEYLNQHPEIQFFLINYANPDMVGHTGNKEAIIESLEVIDTCLQELIPFLQSKGFDILLTSDHGNVDLVQSELGESITTHSLNPVPLIFISDKSIQLAESGILADLAPTILSLLHKKIPQEMTGKILIQVQSPS